MQDRNVILDHRSFANDDAGRVVDEDAFADPRGRVDVGLENARRAALQIMRKIPATAIPKPVCQTVRLQRLKALEIEYRHQETVACGVAIVDSLNIHAHGRAPIRLILMHCFERLPNQIGIEIGMVEPL